MAVFQESGARGRGYVPRIGTYVYSYISITVSLRISVLSSTGTFCASVCTSVRNLLVMERRYISLSLSVQSK